MRRTLSGWARSHIYWPREALGIQLKPFSLGHYLILTYVESPFISGTEIDEGDFLLALHICSKSYEENLDWLFWTDWEDHISEDFKKREVGTDEYFKALELFQDYIRESIASPEHITGDQEDRIRCGAPWVQTMKIKLMNHLHMTESEVMNQWIRKSQYDWFSIIEQNDPAKFRLKNDNDFEIDDIQPLTPEEIEKIKEELTKNGE